MGSGYENRFMGRIGTRRIYVSATDGVIAAPGGAYADATAIAHNTHFNRISVCASGGDAVLLPPAEAGDLRVVVNDGVASAQVFASGADTIDGINGQAVGVPLAAGNRALFVCAADGEWYSLAGTAAA